MPLFYQEIDAMSSRGLVNIGIRSITVAVLYENVIQLSRFCWWCYLGHMERKNTQNRDSHGADLLLEAQSHTEPRQSWSGSSTGRLKYCKQ